MIYHRLQSLTADLSRVSSSLPSTLVGRFLVLLVVVFIHGCGGLAERKPHASAYSEQDSGLKSAVYDQYREWKGTRYRLGGLSKKGVDCSGFVYLTYRAKFGIDLPRTTRYQVEQGVSVSRRNLKPGDLVFFRTGPSKRHVGIYLDNQAFVHASASKGVMLSSLGNAYWSARYWKAKRVLM
jgi:cell wall-associated NlpC family hydrolase